MNSWRLLAATVSVAVFASMLATAGEWPSDEEAKQLVDSAKGILPEWEITRTAQDMPPTGWHTFNAVGFLIEGRRGNDTFSIWLVPRDWIGIRTAGRSIRAKYGEDVLVGKRYKAIITSTDRRMPGALQKLGMDAASINYGGGWSETQRIFKDRFDEADAATQRLMAKHCADRASRDEAAASLVGLGVPAKTAFIDTALNGRVPARRSCLSALGWLGGEDAVEALSQVLLDPKPENRCRDDAARSLERIGDPRAGPALLTALKNNKDMYAAGSLVRAVANLRYTPAAPAVLELMKKLPRNASQLPDCARALGILGHSEAVPMIRSLLNDSDLGVCEPDEIEAALVRLTAPWSKPVNGVRLALQAPREVPRGQTLRITVHIENVTRRVVHIAEILEGTLLVNGRREKVSLDEDPRSEVLHWRGETDLHGSVLLSLGDELLVSFPKPGPYRLVYQAGGLTSNTVTIEYGRPPDFPALESKARKGEREALDAIADNATPEATRTLIKLFCGDTPPELAERLSEVLLMRVPFREQEREDEQAGWYERKARWLIRGSWRPEFAVPLHARARELLTRRDPASLADGGDLVSRIGGKDDLGLVIRALDVLAQTEGALTEYTGCSRDEQGGWPLVHAAHSLLQRGAVVPPDPTSAGEAIVFAVGLDGPEDVRPPHWEATCAKLLRDQHPFVRRRILNQLPRPIARSFVKLLPALLADPDLDVRIAACDASGATGCAELRQPLMKALAHETEQRLLSAAAEALYGLGARLDVLETLVDRLDEPRVGEDCVWMLTWETLEIRHGGGSCTQWTPAIAQALKTRWRKFLEDHREALHAGRRIEVGSPGVTPDLLAPDHTVYGKNGKRLARPEAGRDTE